MKEDWISGSYSKLYNLFLKKYGQEKDDREKHKLLPYLVKNVIHPHGFSFLSYLINKN